MSPIYSLLLLPALVYGKLTIDIDLTDLNNTLLDVRGPRSALITDTERETFKIRDDELKKTIANFTKHAAPADVYIKSTGQKFDLHNTYSWDDIKRTVKPILTVKENECRKYKKVLDKCNVTVASEWQNEGNISTDLEYNVYAFGDSAAFTFSSPWGEKFNKSREHSFGKTVQATKCDVVINVSYESTLRGRVAANYPAKRNNHYFWGYDVNHVLEKAGLPMKITRNQTISISYFKEHIQSVPEPIPNDALRQ